MTVLHFWQSDKHKTKFYNEASLLKYLCYLGFYDIFPADNFTSDNITADIITADIITLGRFYTGPIYTKDP